MKLDKLDKKILRALQDNGRISNSDLADHVGLSASACLRRVRTLESEGVIEKYVALLNPKKLGKRMSVFVEISLGSQSEEALSTFEKAVDRSAEIMECHLMGGDADYILRVMADDPVDFERIHRDHLTRLPGVVRMRSSFAIRSTKQGSALPISEG
ncbi:Transcriptional Regulator, AsnC family [Pseudovibrio sp. FO-BEG1]|uniref:Transcriptional regulator, AsnC family n=2 Tax=Pseudovibrio TaxID=258255 RepID=A0A1I6ZJY9_9HYPH|nr:MULTISPECIES: Lrp/AsnC family transcriptional regulator [Pseudovibrio]AEV38657.1 Transcriptional Regulator, AsnC family [Pseudovibrio sp. FO-BEG1]EEA95650.1 transcriptional regulator, AsnC family [Pseudovibrio sp. JE062]QUS54799.1 Lrp/AsnC family transcriptional regulator [Pseudovibrio brasiliensis]SFT63034.1 transcriptional regulator, AsnC family [Pseudovibrio denitrificans]